MSRLLLLKAPALKIGCEKRLVVAVVTTRPVSARPFLNRSMILSRVASSLPNGMTSSSWKFTP
jgi:hypothetical protein